MNTAHYLHLVERAACEHFVLCAHLRIESAWNTNVVCVTRFNCLQLNLVSPGANAMDMCQKGLCDGLQDDTGGVQDAMNETARFVWPWD